MMPQKNKDSWKVEVYNTFWPQTIITFFPPIWYLSLVGGLHIIQKKLDTKGVIWSRKSKILKG